MKDKYEIGDKVILGEHESLTMKSGTDTSKNWCADMDQYIGKVATITKVYGNDSFGLIAYNVDIDKGQYVWRGVNMTPITFNQPTKSAGASCKKCKEYNSYAEAVPNFVCYGCKH
jgi:hypothetical protein